MPVPKRTQQVIIIHLFFCFSLIFVLFVITWNLCTICISMFCRHFSLTSKNCVLFSIICFFFFADSVDPKLYCVSNVCMCDVRACPVCKWNLCCVSCATSWSCRRYSILLEFLVLLFFNSFLSHSLSVWYCMIFVDWNFYEAGLSYRHCWCWYWFYSQIFQYTLKSIINPFKCD